MAVVADHVYLVSREREMAISGGRLRLRERSAWCDEACPADGFFRALAEGCGARSVAVVLSGSGTEPSQGLREVHDAGGLVVVQDLESTPIAETAPGACADVADWVVSPDEMPRVIAAHARRMASSHRPSDVHALAPPAPSLESELEGLLSSVPDAVYFKDTGGRFVRANDAMAERLGVADPRDLAGKRPEEVPNAAVAVALHRDDETVLCSGEAQHDRLERWQGADGSPDWALVTRVALRDHGGLVGMICLIHDVTEQRRAEETVQEASRRRDQFLAMLSHELRNPLGAIVTATSLLKKQAGPGEQARPLAILERQSLQMARLLDDLLEANRVTQNTVELHKCVFDLRATAREAAEVSRARMESRGVTFTLDLDGEPVWVDGDAARLQQVQVNLLENAAKYTPSGGHASLTLRREGNEAVLRVLDDGSGIATEVLATVFELFAQASRTLDRSQGGLGVGLTLVRSLVTMHGGTVSAHSEGEGRGAEFVVRLPLAERPVPREPVPPAPRSRSRLPAHAKIAVIEDNPDSREMLVEALSRAGYQCREADNGIDGLALIEAERPDVAIIDVGLPAMNGFELARRIRAEPANASVHLVALTGYGMREDRDRALAAGFDDHLVKPIELAALVQHIEGDRDWRSMVPSRDREG